MTTTDTYQLKWHSHSSHLNGSVAALLRSERFTDVVLCTMDGFQIPAHKFILSSCSVYLATLFDGQRSVIRMGGMLCVVLPSEISSRALKILVEYMYKGETTVSNEVLDTVLKAGEVLKIRGLWRQAEEQANNEASTSVEKQSTVNILNKQPMPTQPMTTTLKKPDEAAKIGIQKDDKVIKLGQIQHQGSRPMFIGPPKLVFIKTTDGAQGAGNLRPIAPKGHSILVTDMNKPSTSTTKDKNPPSTVTVMDKEHNEDMAVPRILRRQTEKKYGKKPRTDKSNDADENTKDNDDNKSDDGTKKAEMVRVKEEPEWDASSIEEEERSIAEMFQSEMDIKAEPGEDVDIEEEDGLMYSPLTCELCSEVFTVPAAWVRHVQDHAGNVTSQTRKRKLKDQGEDSDEMALLRCDLCQKHFPNPAEWVRHVQSTHTETELAMSNNSDPPKRHNRFTEGAQTKHCPTCHKLFPSNASMLIHLRTHTGERPYVCGLCNKGFNVKSNLLRHLRTLHEQEVEPESAPPDKGEA